MGTVEIPIAMFISNGEVSVMQVMCSRCHGSGKTELSKQYEDAWRCLEEMGGVGTVQSVAARLNWDGVMTAVNNRLNDMVEMGLLSRHRDGGVQWTYKLVRPA